MANIAEGYRNAKPDSAVFYAQQAIKLARQINFPNGDGIEEGIKTENFSTFFYN